MEEINLWEGGCDSERAHVQSCDGCREKTDRQALFVDRNSKPTILFVFQTTEASGVCRSAYKKYT